MSFHYKKYISFTRQNNPLPQHWLALCLLFSLSFLSCQKVIDVNLNSAEKKYNVEAVITDQPGGCKVLLTQTKDFSEDNTFAGVSGAQVTIADSSGATTILTETAIGVYEDTLLTGTAGHTYNLSVTVAGQVFTATSRMPTLVPFDSLQASERFLFGDNNKYAIVYYNDPLGRGNAYRFVQYVNGVKEKTVFVNNDEYSDGRTAEETLFFFADDDEEYRKIHTGDTLTVDMLCIDSPVYTFWFSLSQSSTGNNQSATPGNPVSNIAGGALGYFSAQTKQSKTIVVE